MGDNETNVSIAGSQTKQLVMGVGLGKQGWLLGMAPVTLHIHIAHTGRSAADRRHCSHNLNEL